VPPQHKQGLVDDLLAFTQTHLYGRPCRASPAVCDDPVRVVVEQHKAIRKLKEALDRLKEGQKG